MHYLIHTLTCWICLASFCLAAAPVLAGEPDGREIEDQFPVPDRRRNHH